MEINLRIGDREIVVVTKKTDGEEESTWSEVLDELVWPALRAYGYVIDFEFTDSLAEEHRQYIADKVR